MTTTSESGAARGWVDTARAVFSPRMAVATLMGFACGLPLLLTLSVLQAWMKESGVDLTTIGLITLVGLPYTLKFLWAPLMDRFVPPFLGRRRGWLLIFQLALMLAISWLGFTDPVEQPWLIAVAAFFVTLFSASQDIVVDAYRREDLRDEELGLGSSLYISGYRVGLLLAGGGGLILADRMPFWLVYQLLALCMLVGVVTTLAAREPPLAAGRPTSLREAVVEPFRDYFVRSGALWILLFILLYKIGDTMASAMTTPFYLDIGFTKTEIGTVVKLYGFWATIIGGLLGGVLMMRWGIRISLWVFGVLQGLSTAGFAWLAALGASLPGLTAVITFENLSGGMGTAAFVGFMASLTNRRFTATQYALLSSLMGIPRVILSAPTGWFATVMGWQTFFMVCALIAIPGLLLLLRFSRWETAVAGAAAR